MSIFDLDPEALLTAADHAAVDSFFATLRSDGWQPCSKEKDFAAFLKHDPRNPILVVKGVATINVPMKKVTDFLGDSQQYEKVMKVCDKMCKAARVVEIQDQKHAVKHAAFTLPPPLWPRDFCYLEIQTRLPDGSYVDFGKSIEHPSCPPTQGRLINTVRGELLSSGYYVEPIGADPESCRVTYQVQCDPKGSIPTSLVNLVCKDQAKNVKRLKDFMEQQ